MIVISILNRKGGSGKTTTAVNLSSQLSINFPDKKILMIDLDTQNHVRMALDRRVRQESWGIHQIFDNTQANHFITIQKTPWDNLDFIPASEEALENNADPYVDHLKNFLQRNEIKNEYHFIIIDTPPNNGAFLKNAIAASDLSIIAFIPQKLDYSGLNLVTKLIKQYAKKDVKIALLPSMIKSRVKHHKNILENVAKTHKKTKLLTGVRVGIQLAEAFNAKRPIQHYAPKSRGAYDYFMLLDELILFWPALFNQEDQVRTMKTSFLSNTSQHTSRFHQTSTLHRCNQVHKYQIRKQTKRKAHIKKPKTSSCKVFST